MSAKRMKGRWVVYERRNGEFRPDLIFLVGGRVKPGPAFRTNTDVQEFRNQVNPLNHNRGFPRREYRGFP
jgi:hypothetical protein